MTDELGLSLKEVIETLLEYSKNKGQIPDLPRFFILINLSQMLKKLYGLKINWKNLVEQWSVNSPPLREPLWLYVIKYLSNLNARTEIVTQVSKRKLLEK